MERMILNPSFPFLFLQNELDKHEKAIHTGVREFKCPEAGCVKAYISHYKLQNHLRNVHKQVIENNLLVDVTCDECGKVVQGPGRLAIHKSSRHPNLVVKESKEMMPTTSIRTTTPRTGSSRKRRAENPLMGHNEKNVVNVSPNTVRRQRQMSITPERQEQPPPQPQSAHRDRTPHRPSGVFQQHHIPAPPIPNHPPFFNFHPYPNHQLQPPSFLQSISFDQSSSQYQHQQAQSGKSIK